jgi:hypothetical protein
MLFLLWRDGAARQRPPASARATLWFLVVGPNPVLVEVPSRFLLAGAVTVAADGHPIQQVEQHHGETGANRHGETVRPNLSPDRH